MGNRLYIPLIGTLMPTRCREMAERLHRKADGSLPEAESAALAQHLASCPYCAEDAARLQWVAEGLRRRKAVSPGFSDRVLRRVAAPRPAPSRSYAPRGFWQWAPAAAGLVLALGVSLAGWVRFSTDPRPQAPVVTVELELADVSAQTVAVAGDFNGWDSAQMKQGADGVWRVRLSLQPGRYQYAFVVDGETWMPDPRASTVVDSGFSGANSVLDVSL
jgi:anti-sigma factor RsiW